MKTQKYVIVLTLVALLFLSAVMISGLMTNFDAIETSTPSQISLMNDEDEDNGDVFQTTIPDTIITVGDITLNEGEIGTTNINITDVTNLGSLQINISWDPSVVNIAGINEYGEFNLAEYINHGTGYVNITGYVDDQATGSFDIGELIITAVGSAGDTCELEITYSELFTADPTPSVIYHRIVNGTATIEGESTLYSIYGMKFNDLDEDGIKDSSEPGIPGWTIELHYGDAILDSTTTASDGSYSFENLGMGSYRVEEVMQSGWDNTTPYYREIEIECSDVQVLFGNIYTEPSLGLDVVKSVKQNCNMPWSEVGITLDPDVCDWVTFRVNVTNLDSHPLDIIIKDVLPDAFIYDDNAYPKEYDEFDEENSTYIWEFDNVCSGEQITVMFRAIVKEYMCDVYTNQVNVTGTYSDICEDITLYGEDSVYVDVLCDEGISVKKFASLDGMNWMNTSIDTLIDDVVYFKVNVTNTGDMPLEGVRVNDTIPDMVSYNYDADPNLSKPFENQKLEWFFVSIPAGESRILTYSVTVNDHGVGDNVVTASACGGTPSDEDTLTIESEGGMNIRKTVSLDGEHWYENVTAPIGATVRFNITLSYFNEEYYLFHIHIKDVLPDGLTYMDSASPKEPVIVNNTLYWNFTSDAEYLINGSKLSIEFDARVTDGGEKVNVVNVTAQECSGHILYDEDTAVVYTPPGPNMNATKLVQASDGSWVTEVDADVGDELTFNITVENPGYVPLYGIDVVDVLPENLSYVAGSAEIHYLDDVLEVEPDVDEENNTLLWNNLNFYTGEYLSPGESISLYYDVEVTGYGLLKNDATIKACKCSQCELQIIKVFAVINVSTIDNDAPVISDPYPEDDATDVSLHNFALEVKVTDGDDDKMDVAFYNDSDDSVIGTETDVSSGDTVSMDWDDLEYNTSYSWYVKVTDGKTTRTSPTWSFTTELEGSNHEPNPPSNPSPANGASNIVRNPTLAVYVSDPDGDALTIRFYDASNNGLIGTDTCPSDCTASVTWANRDYQTTYRWYVVVSDDELDVVSSTWSFTTEALDIDLNLNIEGGLGITLDIENAGSDAAYDVSWSIHVANEGFLNRIDKTESGSVAMISAGSVVYQDMKIFGIGRVEITATASCDGATPVTKVQSAMIVGSFVILR